MAATSLSVMPLISSIDNYKNHFSVVRPLIATVDFSQLKPETYDFFVNQVLQPVFSSVINLPIINPHRQITSENSQFFIKSLFMYFLLNQNRQITYPQSGQDGLLRDESANCVFTIVNINGEERFIKVVPYDFDKKKDCIIFDIANAIIFKHIIATDPTYSYFSDYTAEYLNSFLSYYTQTINHRGKKTYFWDYNRLYYCSSLPSLNINDKTISPYIPNDIITPTDTFNPLKQVFDRDTKPANNIHNRAFVYHSRAISNSISVRKLFKECQTNMARCEDMISNIGPFFYGFLLVAGVKYGFAHNDLHFGNLLFNLTTNRIILLDLGRSFFAHYVYGENNAFINSQVVYEITKLNLDKHSFYSSDCISLTNYRGLFYDTNNKLLFGYNQLEDFERINSLGKRIRYYPLCVFDIIAYGCNIYIYMLYFLYNKAGRDYNEPNFKGFREIFSDLFEIGDLENLLQSEQIFRFKFNYFIKNNSNPANPEPNSIENILKTYEEILTLYIFDKDSSQDYYTYRNVFKIILDALLLCALLYHSKNQTARNEQYLFPTFVTKLDINQKMDFIDDLNDIYGAYDTFDKYEHPLSFIFNNNPNISIYTHINEEDEEDLHIGGRPPFKSLSKSSRKRSHLKTKPKKQKKIDLQQLENTYQNYLDFYKFKKELEDDEELNLPVIKSSSSTLSKSGGAGFFKIKKQLKSYKKIK